MYKLYSVYIYSICIHLHLLNYVSDLKELGEKTKEEKKIKLLSITT